MKKNGSLNLKIKILIVVIVLTLSFIFSAIYFTKGSTNTNLQQSSNLPTYSVDQLSKYDGSDPSLPIYIGMNGYVYDVSTGSKFYAKGNTYNYLTGKDSSSQLNLIGGKIIEKKYPIIGKLI